jgi:phage terminase Nu1 subunit (DNA packaging protein)
MALVTQSEAARILGITPPAIAQAVAKGRLKIVLDEKGRKRIDTSTLAEDYRKSTQTRKTTAHKKAAELKVEEPPQKVSKPVGRPKAEPRISRTQDYIPDYDESRARTEYLKAELLELDRQTKAGKLVPTEEVEAKWIEVITLARSKMLGIPTKAKQRIPDLDGAAMACLEDIVRETLEDLAGEAEE